MQTVKRTYSMRLFPARLQVGKLEELSKTRNLLWNEIIAIEEKAFKEKHLIGEFDLNNMLPALKEEHPEYKVLNSKACQRICKEVYSSYRSFFRLVKKDKTAKPPRKVENVEQFHTVVFNQSGWKFIECNIVRLNGIVMQCKGMDGIDFTTLNVKEVRLKKKNGKYMLDVMHELEIEEPKEIRTENKVLAIDLGIKELVTGVDNLGKVVVLKNKAAKIDKYFAKEIDKVKSKLSKKQKNSRSHIALMTTPLDVSNVVARNNLATSLQNSKGNPSL